MIKDFAWTYFKMILNNKSKLIYYGNYNNIINIIDDDKEIINGFNNEH